MSGVFKLPYVFGLVSEFQFYNPWNPSDDWVDISEVEDNEINLLISDCAGVGIAFSVTTSSGTYSIDWGDENIETDRVSGVTYQHQYVIGSGLECSLGYTTFKLRIYGATGNITRLQFQKHSYSTRIPQSLPILWVVFGTNNITDYSNLFYSTNFRAYQLQSVTIPSFEYCTNCSYMFSNCTGLFTVKLPSSFGIVENVSYMFNECNALLTVDFPTSWGSVTNCNSMFYNCDSLNNLNLPDSWGSVNNVNNMFYNCVSIGSVIFPSSWGSITQTQSMFCQCQSLTSVVLPSSMGNITSCYSMFHSCKSLRRLTNEEYLGSSTSACDFTNVLYENYSIEEVIVISSLVSKITINTGFGGGKITGLRLTNPNSTFSGTSPHVSVNYCSMGSTALNTLFGDLPTLSSKNIYITGNPGAATCDRSIATAKGWTVTG